MTPGHRFMDVDGRRLHVLDFGGEGRPVLLLHGVLGQAWMWHDVARHLEGAGRLLALDFRGYGDSQWATDGRYTTEAHATDAAAVLERVTDGASAVVGFSWGGLVGLALAARRPELVQRLAMIDVPPSFTQPETAVPPMAAEYASHAEAVEAERRLSPRAGRRMLDVMAWHGSRPAPGGRLQRKHDPVFLERWPFRRDDRWDELQALRQPLLLVRASDSPVLSEDDLARMQREVPAAQVARIEDCGHLIAVERPAELAAALDGFLRGGS